MADNDAHKYWAEPSIDFPFVDRAGGLLAVELKRSITGVKPGWRALCQVTHRAVLITLTLAPGRLENAYAVAYSGRHGRVVSGPTAMPLWERHRTFFDLTQPAQPAGAPVGRIVAATAFGPSCNRVLAEFNSLSWTELVDRLRDLGELVDSSSTKEPRRVAAMTDASVVLEKEVESVVV